MLIPIFGSSPTHLSKEQDEVNRLIRGELGQAGLEWRSVGQTDYPATFPLREVFLLAKHCCGPNRGAVRTTLWRIGAFLKP